MAALYVTSLETAAGKSALCAGIGKKLSGEGKKVGFLKPLVRGEKNPDEDARFMKQVFGLEEPLESLCPVLTPEGVKKSYSMVAKGKDVVIIEGTSEELDTPHASREIVDALDARVIIVVRYIDTLPLTRIITACEKFTPHLLGVVVNYVPEDRLEPIRQRMTSLFQGKGIRVLGVLPEDRALFAIPVGDLAEWLGGEILCCPEGSEGLAENIMAGALGVDSGVEYFNRKANKAVVTRGERPDMQLAALETSVRGLFLCGNIPPIPNVLYQAEDKGVPIILVEQDTPATIAAIEDALSKARFHSEKKLALVEQILAQHFDFPALHQSLGLAA
jgi:BioD-like phosphotransacetylase family protein